MIFCRHTVHSEHNSTEKMRSLNSLCKILANVYPQINLLVQGRSDGQIINLQMKRPTNQPRTPSRFEAISIIDDQTTKRSSKWSKSCFHSNPCELNCDFFLISFSFNQWFLLRNSSKSPSISSVTEKSIGSISFAIYLTRIALKSKKIFEFLEKLIHGQCWLFSMLFNSNLSNRHLNSLKSEIFSTRKSHSIEKFDSTLCDVRVIDRFRFQYTVKVCTLLVV